MLLLFFSEVFFFYIYINIFDYFNFLMKVHGFEIFRFYIFPKSATSSVSELRPTGCETVPCLLHSHLHAFALGFIQSTCFPEKSVSIYNKM